MHTAVDSNPISMGETLSANAMSNTFHAVQCAWECSVDPVLGNGPRSYCYPCEHKPA